MNTRSNFLPTMRFSRTLFSFVFRLRFLLWFLLSLSLPVAAKQDSLPKLPYIVKGPNSLIIFLANTWREIGGVLLFFGVLALFWWIYSLNKRLDDSYIEDELNLPGKSFHNSEPDSVTLRIIKLEQYSKESYDKIKSINTRLSNISNQAHEALKIAHTIDSIQKSQLLNIKTNSDNLHAGLKSHPNLPNVPQYDSRKPPEIQFESNPIVETPIADPASVIADRYQDAVIRDDRSALRQMVSYEMSITQDSEQALLRGTINSTTQLQIDKQGGSYLLICQDNKNWLVPTSLTLKSFTTIQPAKGLFVYERDNVSSAELRRPAEVREDRGVWEVVNMGVVAVPA